MDASSSLLLLLAIPAAIAALQVVLARFVGRWGAWAMFLAAAAAFGLSLSLFVAGSEAIFSVPWIHGLGVSFGLRANPFGLFFAMLVSGTGMLIAAYSFAYIGDLGRARLGRYYGALTAFMTAMLGVAVADDLLTMALFWEATSVSSWMLIGFWYEDDAARAGANSALQVTALGGLVMLVGFLLLGNAAGTYSLHELAGDSLAQARLAASGWSSLALLLILVGAFTKSAQVPFHFWLPGAMVAPTPVSAYLHAATMVKAGVFLLGRIGPIFATSPLWAPVVITTGLATFAVGAWQAVFQHDIKGLLARTTVSALGMMTLLYGLGMAQQDSLQLLAHASYKGCLFLCAGIVEHVAGTRDLRRLGGLRRELPMTFVVAVIGVLGLCGLPPALGFHSKEGLYAGILAAPVLDGGWRIVVLAVAVAANALMAAAGLRFVAGAFLGERHEAADHGHQAHRETFLLWGPPLCLSLVSVIAFALTATPVGERILHATSSFTGGELHVSLRRLHVEPLLLSALTLAIAAVIFAKRDSILRREPRPSVLQDAWVRGLKAMADLGEAFSRRWQNGSLHWYFSGTLLFAAALPLLAIYSGVLAEQSIDVSLSNINYYGLVVCVMAAVASLAVAVSATRLAAAISLTAVGFLVAALFVVYRSPDIVLTQILIETVSTILVLLVLFRMPPFQPDTLTPQRRGWNLMVSVIVGTSVFASLLLASSPSLRGQRSIALDYLSRSLAEAGGSNVVNVVIVDFRAMDTQGEITVLVVVALCVWGLLQSRRSVR